MIPRSQDDRRDAVKMLLTEALQLPRFRRADFLDEACGTDSALHAEIADLLTTFDDASDYFEDLAEGLLPAKIRRHGRDPVSPSDPYGLIGATVADYQVVEMLGGGGMGVVYRARHTKLDRQVALKFLPPHLSADAGAKARFLHEARAASALDHPYICTIYDVDETAAGQLFIAMAYYDGETLKERIIRGPLPEHEAVDVASQVARALASAHGRGIIHRDVKPANVMLTREGVVKLLDFGLAKVADATLSGPEATMGTIAYMSPEQTSGSSVDHRTDIWSLGVVLYEALSGRRPFVGDNHGAILHALIHSSPTPLEDIGRGISHELARLVHRCLDKDPEHRYASAQELWGDLHRLQHQNEPRKNPIVLISYDGDDAAAVAFAGAVKTGLDAAGETILDDVTLGGVTWTEQIERDLERADVLILLLSERSLHSEMLAALVETLQQRTERADESPILLPIRMQNREPLGYPLSGYLSGLREMHWEGDGDTPRLVSELQQIIRDGRLVDSAPDRRPVRPMPLAESPAMIESRATARPRLEMPEGTMSPFSSYYIVRPEDEVALRAIAQQGVTITIKGPRQMGKSSLLIRTLEAARELGKDVVFLDFQLVDRASLTDADLFFRQFCAWITDELDIEDRVDAYWRQPLSNGQRCTRYMERHVLQSLTRPVVLALDEVERVFDTDFRSDFFSMLRSWHNDRAIKRRWRDLDLALVTSTEPYQLIENLNQSPFNVGEVIELSEFSDEQVDDLNRRHGSPFSGEEMTHLSEFIGGHPYLVRKALYLVSSGRVSAHDLLTTATDERGPFGDHLRYHLFRLHRQSDLMNGMRQILDARRCDDEAVFWRLRGAGLVRRAGRDVVPRSKLYAEFFRAQLNG